MKRYTKPEIELIETVLSDVVAASFTIEDSNHDMSQGVDEVW